jgi:hypothetical protein
MTLGNRRQGVHMHGLPPRFGIAKAIHKLRPNLPVVAGGNLDTGTEQSSTEAEPQIGSLRQALSAGTTWNKSFGRRGISQD